MVLALVLLQDGGFLHGIEKSAGILSHKKHTSCEDAQLADRK